MAELEPGANASLQVVYPEMIVRYVVRTGDLPPEQAQRFGAWLSPVWNDWVETIDSTNEQAVDIALEYWRVVQPN